MRFRCVNGICVLQRLESRKMIGSIILPDNAQKKSETARVIEACVTPWIEDGKERSTILKAGDVVCISKYSGQEFEISGCDFNGAIVLVREKDILCILDDYEQTPVATPVVPSNSREPFFWGSDLGVETPTG